MGEDVLFFTISLCIPGTALLPAVHQKTQSVGVIFTKPEQVVDRRRLSRITRLEPH